MTKNDNSFHTKLTLQFKDPLLELEYRSFTSSRVIKSPFMYLVTLMICQACFFGLSFSVNDIKFKIFHILLLLAMTFLAIFRQELKKHLENISFLLFSAACVLALVSFGIHIGDLAPLVIYFQMQAFSMSQQILMTWLFRCKFAILWIILSLTTRFVIYLTSNAEGIHVFGLIASITVDIVFLFSVFQREANERKLFYQLVKYRPRSQGPMVDYQDFVGKEFPQSLLVISENLKRELYSNQSFKTMFGKDEALDSFHRVLATLYVHKADFRSREDLDSLFENNSLTMSLYDFLLRSIQANKLADGPLTIYASYLLKLAPRPTYFEVKIMKARWGEDHAIVMMLNDITDQKNFLATKISDGGKDRFLGTVSHELKTPIHGILTMLSIGLKGTRDPEALQVMNYCKKNTLILLNEVNTLLDLQMIRGNKLRLKPCHFIIEELMNEVTSIFEYHRSQKGITLIFEILDGVPKTICTDKDRLTLILMNLIGNGVKFTNIGGIIIRVGVDPMNSDRVIFEVEDTGIGMTESEQRKLCKLYGRVDEVEEDDSLSHGAGIGLTVSNLLVKLLNGGKSGASEARIECVSHYQKGSVFSFSVASDITTCQKFSENEISGFLEHVEELDMEAKMSLYSRRVFEPSMKMTRKVSENLSVASNCGDYEDHHLLEATTLKTPTTPVSKTFIAGSGTTLCRSMPGSGTTLCSSNPSSVKSFTGRRDNRAISIFVTPPTEEALGMENAKKLTGWVLLVDDNPMNLLVARRIIEGTGCQVKTAVNGEDAITKCRQHHMENQGFFKLILMDCQMPIMDGYDATKNLKDMMKSGELPECLIVALTANDSKEDVLRCKESGMDDVLSKPLKDQSLRKIFGYLSPNEP